MPFKNIEQLIKELKQAKGSKFAVEIKKEEIVDATINQSGTSFGVQVKDVGNEYTIKITEEFN